MNDNLLEGIISFSLNIAITAGYFHDNEGVKADYISKIIHLWRQLSEIEENKSGVHLAITIRETLFVYAEKNGCPTEGEIGVCIQGNRHPLYDTDLEKWKAAVLRVATELQKELSQTTMQVAFETGENYYFRI